MTQYKKDQESTTEGLDIYEKEHVASVPSSLPSRPPEGRAAGGGASLSCLGWPQGGEQISVILIPSLS